ncbi:hypothetical protein, partial [Enterobacter cloacae]|uniref:hypothetical protein n=1 Tax=Enterobacter cloacae TaxID=550 RepID=UPI0021AE023E
DIVMLLTDYIDSVYGTARGNRARFLKDNQSGQRPAKSTSPYHATSGCRRRLPPGLASFSLTTYVNVSRLWPPHRT